MLLAELGGKGSWFIAVEDFNTIFLIVTCVNINYEKRASASGTYKLRLRITWTQEVLAVCLHYFVLLDLFDCFIGREVLLFGLFIRGGEGLLFGELVRREVLLFSLW